MKAEIKKYLSEIGRKGGKKIGQVKSAAKILASQENGKKGGRPRNGKSNGKRKGK